MKCVLNERSLFSGHTLPRGIAGDVDGSYDIFNL
jgi:hypothetical protein